MNAKSSDGLFTSVKEYIFILSSPIYKRVQFIDWLQSTILRGQGWNGFDPIHADKIETIKTALVHEIRKTSQGCSYIGNYPS